MEIEEMELRLGITHLLAIRHRHLAPQPPLRPPPVHPAFHQFIAQHNGTDLIWLTHKKLDSNDTNPRQKRLSFPPCETLLDNYLTNREKERIVVSENNKEGLGVMVVDSEGGISHLQFKVLPSMRKFVLTGENWNSMVARLRMVGNIHKVHIWCFRLPASNGSRLCFAIEKTPFA